MRKLSWLCCLVLLLTVLCPVGHVHAESVTTPTDLCEHDWDSATGKCTLCGATCGHKGGYSCVPIDDEYCLWTCKVCNATERCEHWARCDDPTHCANCGYEHEFAAYFIEHSYDDVFTSYGAEGHGYVCDWCGEKLTYSHYAYCDDPTHCAVCGYEGDVDFEHYYNEWVSFGEEGCGYVCNLCGEKYIQSHFVECTDPTTHCAICGYEGKIEIIIHHSEEWVSFGAEGCGRMCETCGEKEVYDHFADCDDPTHCFNCGYEGDMTVCHTYAVQSSDQTGHTLRCTLCGETKTQAHCNYCYMTGANEEKCMWCDYAGANTEILHTRSGTYEHDSIQHWYACQYCKTVVKEAHTWENGVCTVCGETQPTATPTATPIATPTPAPTATPTATPELTYEADETAKPTAKPAHSHTWGEPVTLEATCTQEGSITYTCACGETDVEIIAALGHTFGAYLPNGNGTHSHTCTVCGETTTADCTMADTTIGTMDATACIYCGYLTWNLEDAADGQQGQAVENAVFELVDDSGESLVTESMSLIVYATAPEVTVQLDEGTTVVVKQALTITLLENDAPITLEKPVKLSIPVEEDFTGLKLLVMNADGELIEIEYEVMDGMLVFETDILGIFMLVEEI